jgi:hypothetical protein
MMALNLDMLDVLSKALPGNAPVATPDAPDFAQMIATAEQGAQAVATVVAEKDITPRSSRAQSRDFAFNTDFSTSLDTSGFDVSKTALSDVEPAAQPRNDDQASQPNIAPPENTPHAIRAETVDVQADQTVAPQPDVPTPVRLVVQLPLLIVPMIQTTAPVIEAKATISNEAPEAPAPARPRAVRSAKAVDRSEVRGSEPNAPPVVTNATAISLEPSRPIAELRPIQTEPAATPPADNRLPPPQTLPERALPTLVERMVAFTPTVIDAARDLAQIGDARDMKFNVRPEILGSVAVTIERTDAGQNLRLGVETPAAVQAVRQAEPALNDPRHGNPFVNVTVDMTASDQRGRTPRTAFVAKQFHPAISDDQSTGPAPTGRYA